jgi:addiction module HigA family antidote
MAENHKIDDPEQMKVTAGAPQHPGGWILRNVLKPFGLTISVAAKKISVRRATLNDTILGNSALSRDLAYRLEALTGVEARLMIDMQAAYEEAQDIEKRQRYAREIERLAPAAH